MPESGAVLILKAFGSTLGTILALVFIPPKTRSGFIRRVTVSLPVGVLFSWVPHRFVEFPSGIEGTIGSACLMAFVAWFALGVVVNFVQKMKKE